MTSQQRPDPHLRHCSFENFEQRVVLAGHPLGMVAEAAGEISVHAGQTMQVATTQAGDQFGLAAVREQYGLEGRGQTVAIIDSGIAWDHLAFGKGFGAGYQVVGGWDFAQGDALPYDGGPAGYHGTHVAGIVGSQAAQNLGVAPGVDLVALRVFDDSGFGRLEWVEQALRWVHENRFAFANPITTVNLSLGGDWNSSQLPNWASLENEFRKLNEAGIFISVSAGNAFQKYQTPGLSYPAASPWVVPVASSNGAGKLSDFSQRHERAIAAPGEDIRSAVPNHLFRGTATDRFLTASGTSMAAPYVAGASTLIREALDFMGLKEINQATILQRMLDNADRVFDQITGGWYSHLNLPRALASILVDDYGSDWNSAFDIGRLSSSASIRGTITSLGDQDVFSFKADKSGVVTLRLTSSTGMLAAGQTEDGSARWNGQELTFHVQAGQTYKFSIAAASGARHHYQVEVQLKAIAAEDLGTIRHSELWQQGINGERHFRFRNSSDGLLTILNQCRQGQTSIEVFDAATGQRLAQGDQRLDISAAAGREFLLVVRGQGVTDLCISNLVSLHEGKLIIQGTAGDDLVELSHSDRWSLRINGVHYEYALSQIQQIVLNGRGGHDSLQLALSGADDRIVIRSEHLAITSQAYTIRGSSFESLQIHGGGGNDSGFVFGSTGNDAFEIGPGHLTATLGQRQVELEQVARLHASGGGGQDRVTLLDSLGDDRLSKIGDRLRLVGPGFLTTAQGFFRVEVISRGGYDLANLTDSVHDDQITMNAAQTRILNQAERVFVQGFDRVQLHRQFGGQDQVLMMGTQQADRLEVQNATTTMTLANGVTNRAVGFSDVVVDAGGGEDAAKIVARGNGKTLFANRQEVRLSQTDRSIRMQAFEQVQYQGQDAIGQIVFADFSEEDDLVLRPESVVAKVGNTAIQAQGFDFLSAAARLGNVARYEATAVDYLFMLDGRWQRRS